MAIKKSELYRSIWKSCDELRGGMDASQYKDYILVLLFTKYISDKYAGQPYASITVPAGASFKDMVALKGKPTIGDDINKKIIAPIIQANTQLSSTGMPDFNDPEKLGSGKDMVDRLSNLISIFENPALDFSKNRAGDDDMLGYGISFWQYHKNPYKPESQAWGQGLFRYVSDIAALGILEAYRASTVIQNGDASKVDRILESLKQTHTD